MENEVDKLREQLISELERTNIDYDKVAALSSKILLLDPENVRFSVDAGHINRLGKELVARQETAVSELIKNAYDADSTRVELTFLNTDKLGGTLLISDDGLGMTREQIIAGFMRLSSTEKVHQPISPGFKRSRAGRKGIGRFAAQRLGDKLTIITQSRDASCALRIQIDWSRFTSDKDLLSISNRIEEIEKQNPQGTTLIIEGLTESWTKASIVRVYRYISELIQPFSLSKTEIKNQGDPGFEVAIYKKSGNFRESIANTQSMVFDYAIAKFEAFVDNKGSGYWSVTSDKIDVNENNVPIGKERENPEAKFHYLREIYLQSYYFIYDLRLIPRSQFSMIRQITLEQGGIRVYRNGFRVLPYGEQFNDWLRLDNMQARREILPPAGNINFFGFVQITDTEGRVFEETASREGLIENDAFKELTDFVSRVIRAVAYRVAAARGTRTNRREPLIENPTEEVLKSVVSRLTQIADDLNSENITASDQLNSIVNNQVEDIQQVAQIIVDATEQHKQEKALLLQDIGMLRVLASLGLAIGEFTHEIRHNINALIAGTGRFISNTANNNELHELAIDHDVRLKSFRAYTSYFDRAISENTRRNVFPQDMILVVRSFHKTIAPSALRYGITVHEPDFKSFNLYSCPMHPSEWSSILINLFTNSRKAIYRASVKGEILISVGKEQRRIYLEFSDNGDGIDPDIEDKIFDAFFTTSTPSSPYADEQDEMIGTGLGLKIIRDIVESYDGDISLIQPPTGYKTCFRITFPAATRQELDEYGI